MLKLKIFIVGLFLFLIHLLSQFNSTKTAYFGVWNDDAIKEYAPLVLIIDELQKHSNNGYTITTTTPPPHRIINI